MLSHQHSTLSPHPKHLICHYRTLVDAINHIQPSHIQQSLWNGTAPRNLSVHCLLCGCHPLFNETSNFISSPWPNNAQYRGGSSYRENGWQVSRSALHKCVLSWWWLPGCHLTEGSLVSGPSYAVSHFELSLFLMYTFSCFSNKSLVDSSAPPRRNCFSCLSSFLCASFHHEFLPTHPAFFVTYLACALLTHSQASIC